VRKGKENEIEFQQKVYLGAEVSEKDSFYKEYSMMNPDDGFLVWFMKNFEKFLNMDPIESMIEILKAMAQFEYLKGVSELTQLSMRLGDTRKRLSAKGLRDGLRLLQNASQSTSESS
jgi:hypothetical protein